MRRTAIQVFFDNLSEGETSSVVIAVGFGLLLAFAAGVAYYDRRQRAKEKAKGPRRG